jgi:hypothetical protein
LLAALDREAIRAKHPTPALIGFVGALLLPFRVKTVDCRHRYFAKCYEINSKQRRATALDPLRDGSEKDEGFPRGARETMLARYKRRQLGVVGWRAKRKVIGFFGHVTEQASGSRKSEAVAKNKKGCAKQ